MKAIIEQLKSEGWKQTITTPKRTTMQRGNEVAQVTSIGIIYRLISQYDESQPVETERDTIKW